MQDEWGSAYPGLYRGIGRWAEGSAGWETLPAADPASVEVQLLGCRYWR